MVITNNLQHMKPIIVPYRSMHHQYWDLHIPQPLSCLSQHPKFTDFLGKLNFQPSPCPQYLENMKFHLLASNTNLTYYHYLLHLSEYVSLVAAKCLPNNYLTTMTREAAAAN